MKPHRLKSIPFLSLTVVLSLISFFFARPVLAEVAGPGWLKVDATPVTPAEAQAYYAQKIPARTAQSATPSANDNAATITDEIKELARALQYDPLKIYDYVLNHIDYVPYFGSLKGATLTYLDGSGNDFDQASLMIALLRESKISAQYVYGTMIIPDFGAADQMDMQHWLGVDADNFVISKVLANGHIPATRYGPYWEIDRIWVQADINMFDPAFKIYKDTPGIDLRGDMGYERSAFLSAAGGTAGDDYVQNLNETGLRDALDSYTMNLTNTLRTRHPNALMDQIIGGRSIIPRQLSALPTALNFLNTPQDYWSNIPDTYAHKVTIKHGGIAESFNITRLAGQRLSLTYTAGQTISAPAAHLWLDDQLIAEETAPVSRPINDTMTLSITHPYVNDSSADQVVDFALKRGSTYTIIYDFGGSRLGQLLEKRQRKMQDYRNTGFYDSSRQVLTETLNVIGMTWMRDTTLNANLLGQLAGVMDLRHHRFGIVAQEIGYYIDVKAQISSVTSRHVNSTAEDAYFKAEAHLNSAIEHGVLEQLQVGRQSVSTVKLLQLTNAAEDKVFKVDKWNYASIWPQLSGYTSTDLDGFQAAMLGCDSILILPADGMIDLEEWSGKGYIDYRSSSTNSSINMIIGGDYHGGYGANEVQVDIPDVDRQVRVENTPSAIEPKVSANDPVDMASGYWLYDNTDLSLSGGMGGLAMKRSYNSGSNTIKGILGNGWTHNYNMSVEKHSSSEFGLGTRQPTDATALIAASVATLDVMAGTPDLKSWMVGALIGNWGMDRLTNNATSVHLGTDVLTFIKLPDGTFNSPPGVTSKLVHDNNLYRVEERFGGTVNFGNDTKISSITDADGNLTTFTYDSGKLQSVSDAFNHSLTFSYTGDLLTSVSDSTSRSVSYGYTGNDLTSFTDPENKVWRYGYDGNHRVVTMTSPRDNITTVTNFYDSLGRVKSQTVPRQNATIASYNFYFSDYENIEEDSLGNRTVYYFDEQKHMVAVQDALGNRTVKSFDGQNHVVSVTDPRGNTTKYGYDGNNNLTVTNDSYGKRTTYLYDSQLHLTDVFNPLNHRVHLDYDSEHHPIMTTVYPSQGKSISTRKNYLANGLLNDSIDGKNIGTTFTYDVHGNPKTSRTSTAPAIGYGYDAIGRMTSLIDQNNVQTSFIYDKRGLVTSMTDPLNKIESRTWYADGTLHTIKDRNNDSVAFTYTPTGKTDTVSYPGGTVTKFIYDLRDNLHQMQDSLGTTTYEYDKVNRLISKTDPHNLTVSTIYDKAGNVETLTYPGNKTVTYTYDKLNRLKTVTADWLTQWWLKTATYTYDAAGRLTGLTQFNGTGVSYKYDNAGRMTRLLSWDDMNVIAYYAHTLDDNGNRKETEQTVPLTITANDLDQTFGYNAKRNRLLTAGGNIFTYDNAGQLKTGYGKNDSFDYAHRLTGIGSDYQFVYDGAGNRLKAIRNGVVTKYVYDAGGNLLAEADDNNNITKYYIYGAGLLAMVTSTNEMYCYHFDSTGNTVALTDQSQAIKNKYAYDPFGNLADQQEAVAQPFKFVGEYGVMAEANGFYYMQARYYDPRVGRFISEDPIGFGGGDVNLYAYVGNNPVMRVDPLGLLDPNGGWFYSEENYQQGRAAIQDAILVKYPKTSKEDALQKAEIIMREMGRLEGNKLVGLIGIIKEAKAKGLDAKINEAEAEAESMVSDIYNRAQKNITCPNR